MMGKCIGVLSIAVGVLFVVGHRGVSVAVCSWWFKPNMHQKKQRGGGGSSFCRVYKLTIVVRGRSAGEAS